MIKIEVLVNDNTVFRQHFQEPDATDPEPGAAMYETWRSAYIENVKPGGILPKWGELSPQEKEIWENLEGMYTESDE